MALWTLTILVGMVPCLMSLYLHYRLPLPRAWDLSTSVTGFLQAFVPTCSLPSITTHRLALAPGHNALAHLDKPW